jgi:hypothetical protein
LVVHTAAWLARLTRFLHNDLRRGCGVEMYTIDLKSRGKSEAEDDMVPMRRERLVVECRQRETAHAEAVKVREYCVENISVYRRMQPGGFIEHSRMEHAVVRQDDNQADGCWVSRSARDARGKSDARPPTPPTVEMCETSGKSPKHHIRNQQNNQHHGQPATRRSRFGW